MKAKEYLKLLDFNSEQAIFDTHRVTMRDVPVEACDTEDRLEKLDEVIEEALEEVELVSSDLSEVEDELGALKECVKETEDKFEAAKDRVEYLEKLLVLDD